MPKHIGIIPDGNRRFAKRLIEEPCKGHKWGIEKIKDVFNWCKEFNITVITFYALSLENMDKRPKHELNFLYTLAKKELTDILENEDNFINKDKIKINFFGKIEKLPEDLQECIRKVSEKTKKHDSALLNFAIAYSGRQEVIDACKKISVKIKNGEIEPNEIDEIIIKQNLYTNGMPDPDLIIRTSEQRLSGFMLWQSAYSEIAFSSTFWPEMNKEEFSKIIKDFAERNRRFGK